MSENFTNTPIYFCFFLFALKQQSDSPWRVRFWCHYSTAFTGPWLACAALARRPNYFRASLRRFICAVYLCIYSCFAKELTFYDFHYLCCIILDFLSLLIFGSYSISCYYLTWICVCCFWRQTVPGPVSICPFYSFRWYTILTVEVSMELLKVCE